MNLENYMRVLRRIEEHPEEWDQEYWTNLCGTGCCIAGHAAIIALRKMQLDNSSEVRTVACQFLDIDLQFSRWLFWSKRTLDDFRRVAIIYGWAQASQGRAP